MQKLGFLVDNLAASQLNYFLIKNCNGATKEVDPIIFFENVSAPCIRPNFALMPLVEAYDYDGAIVSTTLKLTEKMINFLVPKKKIFYIWDLEWIREWIPKDYSYLSSIYRHPDLTLFTRNAEYKKVIEDAWNVKVTAVSENCTIEPFLAQ